MFRLIDEIERTRTYPTQSEIELINEIKVLIIESKEYKLMEEIADGDGNISVQSVRDLFYGIGK